jgi:hypothetical protein
MESVIINFKKGDVMTFTEVSQSFVTGNHLIIMSKETEDSEGGVNLLTTNQIFDLSDINNFTTKIKTTKYGNE